VKFFLSSFIILIIVLAGCGKKNTLVRQQSADFPKAAAFYGNQDDSAYLYFNRVVNYSKDSLEIAKAYTYMAWIQSNAGDYFGSQENVLQSQQYLNSRIPSHQYWIAANYNVLGTTSLGLKQYDKAVTYYDIALKSDTNRANHGYYLNNKAVAYEKLKQYDDAIAIYQSVLDQKPDSIKEYARVLSNIAIAKWLRDPGYPAAPELLEALAIRKAKNDSWGLNASFAQLSDFYSGTQPDSALYYAKQMYAVATSLGSADDQLEALVKLTRLEQPQRAAKYFNRYIQLNDSLQQVRSAAKNQFALVSFDARKSKAENLVLQNDNAEKRARINRQRIIFFSLLTIFASFIIIAILWYKKRKQRFLLESSNAVKEQELKISKKVHDVVANGLYQVMTEIEHKEIEKDKLLDKIEVLYEKSRDISYESSSPAPGTYEEKINELLSSFSSPSVKVLIVGNDQSFWENVLPQTKNELEHILQELMINMKKHSAAKNVLVKFEKAADQHCIRYTDDGIGMSKDTRSGNGLKNTGNRIAAIGGTLTFEPGESKGVRIGISFKQ
jgi:tetratricopeptide (TPR) repeat protein